MEHLRFMDYIPTQASIYKGFYVAIIHNHSLMASTDLLSYAICVSNRPPFSPQMSVPNKQMAYPAAAT